MERGKTAGDDWTSRGRRRQVRVNALICLACAVLLAVPILLNQHRLVVTELSMADWLTGDRGGCPANEDLVLVGIDDASLDLLDILDEEVIQAQPHLDAMSYGYPFPRSVYAGAAQKLIDAGARLVVFDMLFTGEREGDDAFREVIEANAGKIVVGCNLVERYLNGVDMPIQKIDLPSTTVIDTGDPADPRIGYVNWFPDGDGKVRSFQPARQTRLFDEVPVRHSLVMASLEQLGEAHRIKDPMAIYHARFPEFSADEAPYDPVPFYSLFHEDDWKLNLEGGERFRGKIVFIAGSSVVGFHDVVGVPEGEILGAQLHMSTLAAALDDRFYKVLPKIWYLVLIGLMAVAAFGIAFLMRRPIVGLLVLVLAAVAYCLMVWGVYSGASVLIPSAAPLFTLGLAGIGCFGTSFVAELLEKARLRRTLERQVSKELAEHIMSVPENYYQSLPGVRMPVTVLFSDIRSFTSRSEKDDPVELVSQLKEYLDEMSKIVFEHGGVVDKFIGDAVMAVWGNLHSDGEANDSRNAVAAAVVMQQRLALLNAKWAEAGHEGFKVGIGLNHGDAIFGMMGSEQKEEMTVIGDPVNQAARLEGLTKKFGQEIIVGPKVAEFVKGEVALRSLGKVRTMGKEEAQELASVLVDDGDAAWLERYRTALEAFSRGDLEAAEAGFSGCSSERPEDLTVAMYLEAIASGDCDGELVMTGK